MISSTLYGVLGLGPEATLDQIKKAYRKLVHVHHPDKKTGDADTFRPIQHAYDVLSDPEKRKRYDETGEASTAELSEAESTFQSIVDTILRRHDPKTSIFAAVENEIRANCATFGQELRANELNERRLKVIKARMKPPAEGRDLAGPLVDVQLECCRSRAASLRQALTIANQMLALLPSYGYDVPDPFSKMTPSQGWVVTSQVEAAAIADRYATNAEYRDPNPGGD